MLSVAPVFNLKRGRKGGGKRRVFLKDLSVVLNDT
jgi:hypothetical protein